MIDNKKFLHSYLYHNKKICIKILFNLALFLTLLLGSLRVALTGNGYTNFAYLTGYSGLVMKNVLMPLSFNFLYGYISSTTPVFQLFILFPSLIINNPILAGKIDMIIIFTFFYLFSYFISDLLYKTINVGNKAPLHFNLIFIALMFVNYDFMYALTGSMMPALFFIPIFLYVLIKAYRIISNIDKRFVDYAKVAIAFAFAGLGDPRFVIWGGIALLGLPLYSILTGKKEGLKVYLAIVLIELPLGLFEYHTWTLGMGITYVSPRPLTYGTVNFFTKSFPLLTYLQLGSMFWPSFTYSPPTVLFLNAAELTMLRVIGHPTAELMPFNTLGSFWFLSTFAFSIALVVSFLYTKGRERIYLFGLLILLTIYVGTYVPLVWLYIYLGRIPFVGGIWAITEAIPNYVAWVIYPIALFYIGIMISRTLRKSPTGRKGNASKITVMLLIALIIFSNWQFFNGSFYPGQFSPVIPGNGISPMSSFYLAKMPNKVQATYNLLSDSLENGSFSVYWPQAYGFTYNWSRRVTGWYNPGPSPLSQFGSTLRNIILRNETWLTLPLMEIYGVKYLVVDNTSYSEMSPLGPPITNSMEYEFFLKSPGVKLVYNYSPYIYVFEAANASAFQVTNESYTVKADPLEVESYFLSIFNSLPVLYNTSQQAATPLSVNSVLVNGSDLLTYDFFAEKQSAGPIPNTYFKYSPTQGIIYIMNDWYFESLSGSGTFNSTDGVLLLSSNRSNIVQLGYGDFLAPWHTAIPIPQGCSVRVHVSFLFKGNPNDSVSSGVWVTNNMSFYTGRGGWYLGGVSEPGSGQYRNVSYTLTIPPGMLYFQVQINPTFSGTVSIKDININYSFFNVAYGYPYSYQATTQAQNQNFTLHVTRPGLYTVGVLYFGNGTFTFSNKTFTLSSSSISKFSFSKIINSSNVSISYSGIHIIGVIILFGRPSTTINANEGFNLLMASVSLRQSHGYLTVSTPYGGWQVTNGSYLGLDAFGRQVFQDKGATAISIKYAYINNLTELAFALTLYAILFYLFVLDNMFMAKDSIFASIKLHNG